MTETNENSQNFTNNSIECESKVIFEKLENTYKKRAADLSSIIENLKLQRNLKIENSFESNSYYKNGETTPTDVLEHTNNQLQAAKLLKKKRMEQRSINLTPNSTSPIPITTATTTTTTTDYVLNNNNNNNTNNNNNNHVKNERLSPGTPDLSSRSRSVTPSSVSHPDTPPAPETVLPLSRNYSDFMRSLAAKYNNTNPNDYFSAARNGFPPSLDTHFKPFAPLTPPNSNNKDDTTSTTKKPIPQDYGPVLNPFANTTMFPPFIDMSSTRSLLALVRTAKEAEIQRLLKNAKRQDASSPLDLSASTAPPPTKKPKISSVNNSKTPTAPSSPTTQQTTLKSLEDVNSWSVDDVCNFISGIDICAEYVQIFRDQRIDGSGLPLLTEEHLTTTMNMKLGPALKLRSILAKKLGSCSICLHCTHCHNSSNSPELNATGNSSDSGGAS